MSNVLGVRFSGPLESYADGFAAELTRLGYKRSGVKGQLFMVAYLSRVPAFAPSPFWRRFWGCWCYPQPPPLPSIRRHRGAD